MENYEKKYKKALEKLQEALAPGEDGCKISGLTRDCLTNIFPELTEDEDENTRKELLAFIKNWKNPSNIGRPSDFPMFTKNKEQCDKYIAWIEKQGEKVTNINGEDYGIDGLYHAIKILEETVGKVTGYQSDDGILEHKAAINAVKELYKKQGGQEHFYDFNANDWYVSKVDGKIHNMTYNPNKVEPK